MAIRGVKVDHATIQRWVYKFSPQLEASFRRRRHKVGKRWRMDEAYIKVKGEWMYLYRVVDKEGNTIDFLLTKRRQRMSAQSFLIKAINNNGCPELINIDKSGSNKGAIKAYRRRSFVKIRIRQCKNLNNIVEQDHRFIKKRVGQSYRDFESARRSIAGIEMVHMIKKGQMDSNCLSAYKAFYSLAA